MKHCPACNFSFPDFHIVCDFDGTELVQDPQRIALMKLPARRSFVRRVMTSPKTLTALAILGLFCLAAFIAFQQITFRSSRTLLAANVAAPAPDTPAAVRVGKRSNPNSADKSGNPVRRPMHSQHSASLSSSVLRNRHEKRNDHLPAEAELARRSEPERQPKVVAMLKTTWRVLKKPFSF